MARYLIIAMNGPTPEADETEFNRWYDEVHVPELAAVDGIVAARRFKVVRNSLPAEIAQPYASVYEIETDDLAAVFERMQAGISGYSPLLDRGRSQNIIAVEITKKS